MKKKFIPAYLLTFVNVLGFSILLPVLPFVVQNYGAPKWVYGFIVTCYSAFQFLGASYLGSLSDQKGRKSILLFSQAGTLLSWLIFLAALFLPNFSVAGIAFPLFIIAGARILDGITAGNNSVTNAYLSDITTKKEKSYIFGYMGGITGIGMIVGPTIGGFTASSSLGYKGTIIASILISTIALITIFFWLRESHPLEKRTKTQKNHFFYNLFILKKIKEVNPNPIIKLLFLLKFIFCIMSAFYISTIALFIIDLFDFNEKQLGKFMFIVGLFLAFNQAIVSKVVIKKLGEVNTLLIGFALSFLGCILITLTKEIYTYCLFYYILNLGFSLCFPTFNSLIAIHGDAKNQGEIMGINDSILSFCMAAFPILAAYLYSQMSYSFYYITGIFPLLCFFIAIFMYNRFKVMKNS